MKTYMNINEVAMFLGHSPKAIRKLMAQGQIPYRRLGRRFLFVRPEVEACIHALPGMHLQEVRPQCGLDQTVVTAL